MVLRQIKVGDVKKRGVLANVFLVSVSAVVLASTAMTGSASASCTGLNTATISCTGTDTGAMDSLTSGNTNATLTDWQIIGLLHVHTNLANTTATMNATNVTGSGNAGSDIAVLQVSGAAAGDNASMTVSNSTITQTSFGHGIAARANNATGNAISVVTDTSITMAATATT